jgi:hypothetical protein
MYYYSAQLRVRSGKWCVVTLEITMQLNETEPRGLESELSLNSVVPTELRSSIEAVGVIHFISQWVFSTPKASTLSLCLGSALSHTIDWAEKADFSVLYY